MTEKDYVTASNLTRLRIIRSVLSDMIATKDLTEEQIRSFQQWTHRMVDRHHALVEGLKP